MRRLFKESQRLDDDQISLELNPCLCFNVAVDEHEGIDRYSRSFSLDTCHAVVVTLPPYHTPVLTVHVENQAHIYCRASDDDSCFHSASRARDFPQMHTQRFYLSQFYEAGRLWWDQIHCLGVTRHECYDTQGP